MKTRKTNNPKQKSEIFDSIKGAAAFLGEDVSILTEAKADGCPAFRHSKVYIGELTAWLKDRPKAPAGRESERALRRRRLLAQCEKIEHELGIARGNYIAKDDVKAGMTRVAHAMKSRLLALPGEMPGMLVGKVEHEIQKLLFSWVHETLTELHKPDSPLYRLPSDPKS